MSLKITEAKIYDALYSFFLNEGFELLIEKKQFRKITPTGFINVIFSISEYEKDSDVWVEVHIGGRNHQIEQIAQQFLNVNLMDFRADANTVVISTGKYNDVKYFRYKIHDSDDLHEACASIRNFMNTTGLGFLKKVSQLSEINRLLNRTPTQPSKYLYNQIHRCFKGLIAAKLTENPRYLQLIETYRKYVHQNGTETELQNYERLVAYLQYYSAN